jgi:hypothetical protein
MFNEFCTGMDVRGSGNRLNLRSYSGTSMQGLKKAGETSQRIVVFSAEIRTLVLSKANHAGILISEN